MWVEFSDNLIENDYTYSLAGVLDTSRVEAAGFIALLISYGLKVSDDVGTVDHLTDKALENACHWEGQRGQLITAFCESGVLQGSREDDDHPLTICPTLWTLLASHALNKRMKWREEKKNQRNAKQRN